MTKKLRYKFIWIIMSIITIMLCIIMCMIYFFTKMNLENNSIHMLQNIATNPFLQRVPGELSEEVGLPYFTLQISTQGELMATGGGYYDLSDEYFLKNLIRATFSDSSRTGIIKEYKLRYYRVSTPINQILVYADISSEQATLNHLLRNCIGIGLICLLVFFIISVLLARWVVRPVEQAWEQQRRFIADASHELKTPMVMLSGYSEALLDDIVTEPDEVKEMVSIIKDESDRMNKLVNELLIIARMDSDEVLYDITPQDFNILLEELHQRFSFEMRDNELTLEINIPADTVVFPFDYDKLNQVFTNLIDNAIRYTKAGGVITINVSREDDGYITVEVKDTGTGIKRENLKHIFERFYKADEARTRGKHGTGLGLYIVSNIITNHDGTITADSLVGEGTTFTIKLPENRKE